MSNSSRLCERCKVLEFDDAEHGGQALSQSGEEILKFDGKEDSLDPHELKLVYHFEDTHPEFPGLQASASAGCGFCHLLRTAILRKYGARFAQYASSLKSNLALDAKNGILITNFRYIWKEPFSSSLVGLLSLVVELRVKGQKLGTYSPWSLVFSIDAEAGTCATWLNINRRPLPGSSLGARQVLQMREWITHCATTCCPPLLKSDFMPTRLIDVGNDSGRDAFLIDSAALTRVPVTATHTYAALSYCWGSDGFLKTESESLSERRRGIPQEIMPVVFWDAITVCRKLGIRYLWIDALCIIQDDEHDWNRECGKMSEVFRQAHATICAVQSSSCHESFLARRNYEKVALRFKSSVKREVEGIFNLQIAPQDYSAYDSVHQNLNGPTFSGSLDDDIKTSLWAQRGWVYQESILSKRKLIFGNSMTHFECKSHRLSADCFPYDKIYYSLDSISGWTDSIPDEHSADATAKKSAGLSTWKHTIARYGRTKLSFERDRLPAIGGLAKITAERTGDDYLAGIWKSDLSTLLWYTKETRLGFAEFKQHLQSPSEYIAPSWSWASISSASYFRFKSSIYYDRLECRLIDTNIVLLDVSNPYGRVSGGHITVEGRMSSLSLKPKHFKASSVSGYVQNHWKTQFHSITKVNLCLDWIEDVEKEAIVPELQANIDARQSLQMLLLMSGIPLIDQGGARDFAGLLLLPTAKENEFQRVGAFFIRDVSTAAKPYFFDNWETRTIRLI